MWYFFSEIWKLKSNQTSRLYNFKNWNQTKQVSYIFLKPKLNRTELVTDRTDRFGSIRFGQGISPVRQAKCHGHFACGTGEMALKYSKGPFRHSHRRNGPKKVKPNHKLGIFLKSNYKNWNFFKLTTEMEFWKF